MSTSNTAVLFLYTELAGYTVSCLNRAAITLGDVHLHIVRYPVNPEAPFQFEFGSGITVHEKHETDLAALIDSISPAVTIVAGWADRDYIRVCKRARRHGRVMLMFDNYWESSLRQRVGQFVLRQICRRNFDACWVPGRIQAEYAKRLGFDAEQVHLGFYATDLTAFLEAYHNCRSSKETAFPKSWLYVGRYLELKGVLDLWDAFEVFARDNEEWELQCVGAGELTPVSREHPRIYHHGFIQPADLIRLVEKSGVLVMPSHYDHWGMAVQEFAAAGMPLLLSNTVGAGSDFLEQGVNGLQFKAKRPADLVRAMHEIASWSTERLQRAGARSHELAGLYDIDTWTRELECILTDARS